MNIYIQHKTAQDAGVLNEINKPLDSKIDKLFCWNVALVNKYSVSPLFDEVDTLIIKNAATHYCILVPFVKSLNQDLFKFIEKYIHEGLSILGCSKEVLDNYFERAGKYHFGILNNKNTQNNIRDNAIHAYARYGHRKNKDLLSQLQASKEITEEYNTQYKTTRLSIMKEALEEFYLGKRKGQKAYELLITLDVGAYKITRRIIVPANINFFEFHQILISIFNWWDYHMASFLFNDPKNDINNLKVKKELVLMPDEYDPELSLMDDFNLSDLLEDYKETYWLYDYGDYWLHKIEVLDILKDYNGDIPYLLEAEYNAPPEDVGGTPGFLRFLEAINDPNNENHESFKEWRPDWKPNLTKKEKTPHKIIYSKRDNR